MLPLRIRPALLCLLPLLGAGCASLSPLLDPPSTTGAPRGEPGVALGAYLSTRDVAADTSDAYRPYIALLPFTDDSGFREGIFELEHEIPNMLTAEMAKHTLWRMVPYAAVHDAIDVTGSPMRTADDAVAIGDTLKADFVGRGTLLDFNLERMQVGDVMLGGYKSYKGTAEMEATLLRVSDGKELSTIYTQKEVIDRGLGLDLLGKPRKQDLQFSALSSMEFGSDEFLLTALGQATSEAFAAVIDGLSAEIRPGVEIEGEGAKILSVEGEDIFINLGSKNGLHQGYRFRVLPGRARALDEALDPATAIAVVEVVDIIGGRLSRVSRRSGEGIAAGDRLQFIETPE